MLTTLVGSTVAYDLTPWPWIFFKTWAKYCRLASKKCIYLVSKALAPIQWGPIKRNKVAFLKIHRVIFASLYLVAKYYFLSFFLFGILSWERTSLLSGALSADKAKWPTTSALSLVRDMTPPRTSCGQVLRSHWEIMSAKNTRILDNRKQIQIVSS